MPSVLHADGSKAKFDEYVGTQASLMAKFSIDLLRTGPEQYDVCDEIWANLEQVMYHGIARFGNAENLKYSEIVNRCTDQWVAKFAHLFGLLARIEQQPLELVHAEVDSYQHRVIEAISVLRHLWHEKTRQHLSIYSAWAQVRWEGPKIVTHPDWQDDAASQEHCLHLSALFPHVVSLGGDIWDLRFAKGSVHPETLYIPVKSENVAALEKDIAKYS